MQEIHISASKLYTMAFNPKKKGIKIQDELFRMSILEVAQYLLVLIEGRVIK